MWRRGFLSFPLLAATSGKSTLPFRLSVRVEPLFPGLSMPDQLRKVAEAGYQGFEFGDWRAQDHKQINALKNKLGLTCVNLVGNKGVNPVGMGLCNPAERAGFLAEIAASTDAAVRFETDQIVVLSGFKVAGMSRVEQHASIVEGLKRAHDIVEKRKVTMVVEVVNTLAPVEPLNPKGNNHHDYYLDRTAEAFEIVREVGGPFVKILYDAYHTQIMEGNLIETIRKNISAIGHFHVGDVPGRHEPGTGEIDYRNVFRAIRDTGYKGFAGMEYLPSKDAVRTLKDVRRMVETL